MPEANFEQLLNFFANRINSPEPLKVPEDLCDVEVYIGFLPDTSNGIVVAAYNISEIIEMMSASEHQILMPSHMQLADVTDDDRQLVFIFDSLARAQSFFPDQRVVKFEGVPFGPMLSSCHSIGSGFIAFGEGETRDTSKAVVVEPNQVQGYVLANLEPTHLGPEVADVAHSNEVTLTEAELESIEALLRTEHWWSSYRFDNVERDGEDVNVLLIEAKYGIVNEGLDLNCRRLSTGLPQLSARLIVSATSNFDLGFGRNFAN